VNTSTAIPGELLVLSGHGIRVGVLGHYGLFDATPDLATAIKAARAKLAEGHACAFVAYRIEAKVIGGIGDGTERELVRFEVYPDRVALVPPNQGGLSEAQATKVRALPKKGSCDSVLSHHQHRQRDAHGRHPGRLRINGRPPSRLRDPSRA
jgi:hypothetical protein